MIRSAAGLADTAEWLRVVADFLDERAEVVAGAHARIDDVLGAFAGLDGPWQGPVAAITLSLVGRHRDDTGDLALSLSSAAASIRRAGGAAGSYVAAVRRCEYVVRERYDWAGSAVPEDLLAAADAAAEERRRISADWTATADAVAVEVSAALEAIAAAMRCSLTGVFDGPLVAGDGMLRLLLDYSAVTGLDLATIGPDGELQRAVNQRVDRLRTGGLGEMEFDVIETLGVENVAATDDIASHHELVVAASDPVVVEAGVRAWAAAHGVPLDNATVDYLTGEVMLSAAALLAVHPTGDYHRRGSVIIPGRQRQVLAAATAAPPATGAALLAINGDPATTAAWWAAVSPDEAATAIAVNPRLIGNLDGLPAAVRDQINRVQLNADLDVLGVRVASGEASELERRAYAVALESGAVLEDYAVAPPSPSGAQPAVQLYTYEPFRFDGDGAVAISLGDLDTADYVAVMVAGLGSDASGLDAARPIALYQESSSAAGGGTVAVLHWQAYDAPSFSVVGADLDIVGNGVGPTIDEAGDIASVINRDRAEAGALRLSVDVDGVRAMRGGDQPHLTVVANSYGSTTALIAADHHLLAADALVVTGSPGAGDAQSVTDLSIAPGQVYVLSASTDLVTYLGNTGGTDDQVNGLVDELDDVIDIELMGNDPATAEFGAERLAAEYDGRDRDYALVIPDLFELEIGANLEGHNQYYEPGGESLYNIAAVVADRPDLLIHADGRSGEHVIEVESPVEVGVDPGDLSAESAAIAPLMPVFALGEVFVDYDAEFIELELPIDPERQRPVAPPLSHRPQP